jgi:dipeptidyl aminopeptidase/acylaminoacyl peptidase
MRSLLNHRYFPFLLDYYFVVNDALGDVTIAVREVIKLGYADPARVGLQGYSWRGYESSFIVTQTDVFAAVVVHH